MKQKNEDEEFLKTNVSYAVVFHGDLNAVQELKERINKLELNLEIIYQTVSGNKLYITENREGDSYES